MCWMEALYVVRIHMTASYLFVFLTRHFDCGSDSGQWKDDRTRKEGEEKRNNIKAMKGPLWDSISGIRDFKRGREDTRFPFWKMEL